MKAALKVLLVLVAVCVLSCGGRAPQQSQGSGSTVVLIVRHAEKASEDDDSPLTEAGVQRAQALVRVAEEAGVSAIYSSQFRRSQETARPIAERAGVAVTQFPVDLKSPGDYGKRLAGDIMAKHAGQTVLVVGHGNTVAATIEALTGQAATIGDVQYGNLFIVTVAPSGVARVIKAQYGS